MQALIDLIYSTDLSELFQIVLGEAAEGRLWSLDFKQGRVTIFMYDGGAQKMIAQIDLYITSEADCVLLAEILSQCQSHSFEVFLDPESHFSVFVGGDVIEECGDHLNLRADSRPVRYRGGKIVGCEWVEEVEDPSGETHDLGYMSMGLIEFANRAVAVKRALPEISREELGEMFSNWSLK